jgi:DNA modification methylase
MKPVPLVRRMIENSSGRGELVLDIFAGSGTTLIAAQQLGRHCHAMELDPRYCDVIVERWRQLTHQDVRRIPATEAAA